MIRIVILLMVLNVGLLNAQLDNPMEIFQPLVGKTWEASGKWSSGQDFKQEITFRYDLNKKLVIAESKGYTDQEQTAYGDRNYGVRQWNPTSGKIEFWEHDVFGGTTKGIINPSGNNLYYEYQYGDETMTDGWEKISDTQYKFIVGSRNEGQWEKKYLETLFNVKSPAAEIKKTEIEQNDLPYAEIPEYPEEYNAATVAARMIDGLGFRYYWGSIDLREEDLTYKISETNRTTRQTLDHIFGLSKTIINAVKKLPNMRSEDDPMTYQELRAATLNNLKQASDILRKSNSDEMSEFLIIFQRGENRSEFPFWNQVNGPIADAIWHTGQIVAFRRASGNPLPSGVSVLRGTRRVPKK